MRPLAVSSSRGRRPARPDPVRPYLSAPSRSVRGRGRICIEERLRGGVPQGGRPRAGVGPRPWRARYRRAASVGWAPCARGRRREKGVVVAWRRARGPTCSSRSGIVHARRSSRGSFRAADLETSFADWTLRKLLLQNGRIDGSSYAEWPLRGLKAVLSGHSA